MTALSLSPKKNPETRVFVPITKSVALSLIEASHCSAVTPLEEVSALKGDVSPAASIKTE